MGGVMLLGMVLYMMTSRTLPRLSISIWNCPSIETEVFLCYVVYRRFCFGEWSFSSGDSYEWDRFLKVGEMRSEEASKLLVQTEIMEALIDNHCLERLTRNLITAGRSPTKKEGLLDLELERGNLADIELAATELLSIETRAKARGEERPSTVLIAMERLRISKKDITYVLGILLDLLTDPSKIGGEYQPSHNKVAKQVLSLKTYHTKPCRPVREPKQSSSPLQEDLLAYQFETKLGSFFPGKKGLLPLSRTCTTHSVFLRSGSATALYDFLARFLIIDARVELTARITRRSFFLPSRSSHKLSASRSNTSRTQWYRRKRVTIKKEIVQHNSHSYKRGQWLQMSEGQVASVTARKLEPVSGDGQGAQRATSTAKAAVAVVEARNRLKAFPSVEGPYFTYVSHSREKMILSTK
ncbi:hypothetical protein V6N11_013976, partial [Hibiscus sabdariffa]